MHHASAFTKAGKAAMRASCQLQASSERVYCRFWCLYIVVLRCQLSIKHDSQQQRQTVQANSRCWYPGTLSNACIAQARSSWSLCCNCGPKSISDSNKDKSYLVSLTMAWDKTRKYRQSMHTSHHVYPLCKFILSSSWGCSCGHKSRTGPGDQFKHNRDVNQVTDDNQPMSRVLLVNTLHANACIDDLFVILQLWPKEQSRSQQGWV